MTEDQIERRVNRYLKIMDFVRERYGYEGNVVVFSNGRPTRYTLIEDMAAARYLGLARRF